jgi:hypothetical protein
MAEASMAAVSTVVDFMAVDFMAVDFTVAGSGEQPSVSD